MTTNKSARILQEGIARMNARRAANGEPPALIVEAITSMFEPEFRYYDRQGYEHVMASTGSIYEDPRPAEYTNTETGVTEQTTCAEIERRVNAGEWEPEHLECADAGNPDDPCDTGPVEYRMSNTRTQRSSPLCARHQRQRLDRMREIDARYPDSDSPPEWFDESYAGERWNDDY